MDRVAATVTRMEQQIDKIDSEMIDYMAKHGRVKTGELAELIGIGASSIRVRLFKLMAQGLVSQRKTRNHRVWFFVNENEKRCAGFFCSKRKGEMTYFDPLRGYVTLGDDYESDTTASVKIIMAALKAEKLSDDLYDAVERSLHKYQVFVKQGVRETIAKHKGISWYLTDSRDGRALISYQDGPRAEWANNCYADEVPLWLLIGLIRRIARRKPLGDQDADETIARVHNLDAEYVQKAPTLPHYASYVEDHGDE